MTTVALLWLTAGAAQAATFTVTVPTAAGAGSLRQAVLNANATPGPDTIEFNIGGGGAQTITLTNILIITDDLTIDGSTQPGFAGTSLVEISGNNMWRVFQVISTVVVMDSLTITDGGGTGGSGILNITGTVTLTNSTVSGNSAPFHGGGISNNSGTLTLTNSTVSGNSSGLEGGGIWNLNGTLTLTNCTISGNSAGDLGGGILHHGGSTLTLTNSIVADSLSGADCVKLSGTVNDNGYNIVEDGGCISHPTSMSGDPMLGPLADNGGPNQTHALLPGSIAIGIGDCAGDTVTTDQRGVARPQGADCDIGSFEVEETCGNAILEGGEQCDDGNTVSGDCCAADCTLEGSGSPCADGVGCTDDACDGNGTCISIPDDAICDNGLYCDGEETCDGSLGCLAGTAPDCDDGVGCTDDSCNEDSDSCEGVANDDNCDNGLFCDGVEYCDAVTDCQSDTDPCDPAVEFCDEDADLCLTPGDVVDNLADDVMALTDAGVLNDGQDNSLMRQLGQIRWASDRDKLNVACNTLADFIGHVQGLVSDGVLTAAEGQALIDDAQTVSALLGC